LAAFLFFEKQHPPPPDLIHRNVAGTNFTKAPASLALENLEFEERPLEITKSTLELADLKQSSP
jgi:hypothetical protein